jgi:hypothetical protein
MMKGCDDVDDGANFFADYRMFTLMMGNRLTCSPTLPGSAASSNGTLNYVINYRKVFLTEKQTKMFPSSPADMKRKYEKMFMEILDKKLAKKFVGEETFSLEFSPFFYVDVPAFKRRKFTRR